MRNNMARRVPAPHLNRGTQWVLKRRTAI